MELPHRYYLFLSHGDKNRRSMELALFTWQDVDCTAFSYDHFYANKTHPAFNDDYDIAWALLSIAASKKTKSLKEAFPTIEHWKEILRSIQGDEVISWVYANFQQSIPREVVRQLCEKFILEEMNTLQ